MAFRAFIGLTAFIALASCGGSDPIPWQESSTPVNSATTRMSSVTIGEIQIEAADFSKLESAKIYTGDSYVIAKNDPLLADYAGTIVTKLGRIGDGSDAFLVKVQQKGAEVPALFMASGDIVAFLSEKLTTAEGIGKKVDNKIDPIPIADNAYIFNWEEMQFDKKHANILTLSGNEADLIGDYEIAIAAEKFNTNGDAMGVTLVNKTGEFNPPFYKYVKYTGTGIVSLTDKKGVHSASGNMTLVANFHELTGRFYGLNLNGKDTTAKVAGNFAINGVSGGFAGVADTLIMGVQVDTNMTGMFNEKGELALGYLENHDQNILGGFAVSRVVEP